MYDVKLIFFFPGQRSSSRTATIAKPDWCHTLCACMCVCSWVSVSQVPFATSIYGLIGPNGGLGFAIGDLMLMLMLTMSVTHTFLIHWLLYAVIVLKAWWTPPWWPSWATWWTSVTSPSTAVSTPSLTWRCVWASLSVMCRHTSLCYSGWDWAGVVGADGKDITVLRWNVCLLYVETYMNMCICIYCCIYCYAYVRTYKSILRSP